VGDTDAKFCRGIRGAISVDGDSPEAVADATRVLLTELVEANSCRLEDVAAAIFSLPADLTGADPGVVARNQGWERVPLLIVREGAEPRVERCLRVLVLWNTSKGQHEIRHLYLGGAAALRPDLADHAI
jgi:chorismate mutase